MEHNCYISLSANLEGSLLHFFLADNGSGISSERLEEITQTLRQQTPPPSPALEKDDDAPHHFIGLLNVHQRIQSYYGKEYGLSIESSPGEGTIIDIQIPYRRKPLLSGPKENPLT